MFHNMKHTNYVCVDRENQTLLDFREKNNNMDTCTIVIIFMVLVFLKGLFNPSPVITNLNPIILEHVKRF